MFETMTYDPVGNMLTRTDFNGRTTSFSYDARNRQLNVLASAVAFPGEPGIARTYTATGRVASMVDASGTTTWTYDNQDRVLTKSTPQGALTYSYLPNSLVASVNSSNANGYSVNYAYDVINRLSGVTDNRLGNTTTNTYDDVNNVATIVYPNGVVHSFTVDPKDQVTGLQVQRAGAVFATYGYTRAATGAINGVAENTGRNTAYTYDSAWRLINETISGDPIAANNGSLTYLLDAGANRTSLTSTLVALGSQTFAFDANDRIIADTSDANGNTVASNGKTYTYDFLDRLTSATGGFTLVYDGDDNRVARTVGGVTTRYLIDGQTPLGYTQVAEEIVDNTITRRYVYGIQRIMQAQSGAASYYIYDGGGTTRALADSTGSVTDTFAYDAFGNLIARTGTTPNDMLYRGEQFDAGLGYYYLRARWYEPLRGRFITADKYERDDSAMLCCEAARFRAIEFQGSAGIMAHPVYSHTSHSPVNLVDPEGRAGRIMQGALITNKTSALSVAVGTGAAVAGACGLGPALTSLLRAEMRTAAAYLVTMAMNSPCGADDSALPLPGDREDRPEGDSGNCPRNVLDKLEDSKDKACNAAKPCLPRVESSSSCSVKMANIESCIVQRVIIMAACFNGGNRGHRIQVAQELVKLNNCRKELVFAQRRESGAR